MTQPVALVTNAREFAGPAAVAALHAAGFHVFAHDRSFADATQRETYRAEHPHIELITTDDPTTIIATVWEQARHLHVLVSNDAFPAIHGSIADAQIADLQHTLERLVVFPFALAKAAIPKLKDTPNSRVVMITSNRTRLPQPGGAIPDAARAGANALVTSLSLELAPHGIPVNAIAPNYLYSETYYPRARFIDNPTGRAFIQQVVPVGRLADPAEIGELICYLATMKGTFLTGAIIDFSGGWPMAPARPE